MQNGGPPRFDQGPPPRSRGFVAPILAGSLVGMVLLGVVGLQTYIFLSQNMRHQWAFISIIVFLFLLSMFESMLDCHILFQSVLRRAPWSPGTTTPLWSIGIHPAISATLALGVQGLFASHIYSLSQGNWVLTSWIVLISIANFASNLAVTIRGYRALGLFDLARIRNLLYPSSVIGTTCAISLAIALCYLYQSVGAGTLGERSWRKIINNTLLYTVNTCVIVACVVSMSMVTFIVFPGSSTFMGFYIPCSKLYLNAYLTTLNAHTNENIRILSEQSRSLPESFALSHLSSIDASPRGQQRSHSYGYFGRAGSDLFVGTGGSEHRRMGGMHTIVGSGGGVDDSQCTVTRSLSSLTRQAKWPRNSRPSVV